MCEGRDMAFEKGKRNFMVLLKIKNCVVKWVLSICVGNFEGNFMGNLSPWVEESSNKYVLG